MLNHAIARGAILRAADAIEKENGARFRFSAVRIPSPEPYCGPPGCALGWISAFTPEALKCQLVPGSYISCLPLLGIEPVFPESFYGRMDKLVDYTWRRDAAICARGLRLYADAYHPAVRTDAELVSDLMAKVESEPFVESAVTPDKVTASAETA